MSCIYYNGEKGKPITPETAEKWFCWHEIVAAMQKDEKSLKETERIMNKPENENIPNWELTFLKTFVSISEQDLII